jgi:hypothetical protein
MNKERKAHESGGRVHISSILSVLTSALDALERKIDPPTKKPHCCEQECPNDAEFSIHGSSGHFEDVTEACEEHVGALLGTSACLEKPNEHWRVYPMGVEANK